MARYFTALWDPQANRFASQPGHGLGYPTHTGAVDYIVEAVSRLSTPDARDRYEHRVLLDLASVRIEELPVLVRHDPVLRAVFEAGRSLGAKAAADLRRYSGTLPLEPTSDPSDPYEGVRVGSRWRNKRSGQTSEVVRLGQNRRHLPQVSIRRDGSSALNHVGPVWLKARYTEVSDG